MALDFDTVYEAFRTGVSQGVFTITQPGQLNHAWIAEGTWLPAGAKAKEKNRKYSAPVIEDKDAPPVLHRRSEKADTDSGSANRDKKTTRTKTRKTRARTRIKDKAQKPATAPVPPAATAPASAPSLADAAKAPASDEPIDDPNRPRLRRGKPDSTARREPFTTFDPLTDAASCSLSGRRQVRRKRKRFRRIFAADRHLSRRFPMPAGLIRVPIPMM